MQPNRFEYLMYERGGYVVLDPVGTVLALLFVVVLAIAVGQSRLPRSLKQLVYAALALRVVGSAARYYVLFAVYGGSGDARGYYSGGLQFAEQVWNFNFAPLFSPDNWASGRWWGTQFVYFPSTLVQTILGPSMPGGFLVFSLFAFAGLCGFVLAFQRSYPDVPVTRYARWVWLFPALWFWPSSIGKEAIVLLGLGMLMAGYVGRNGMVSWVPLVVGGFLVFGIRPQVAAVAAVSIMIAHWLSLVSERWTLRNTMQAVALGGVGILTLYYSTSMLGFESFDMEGVQTFVENDGARELQGGSAIEAVDVGILGIPFALINILLRPFIWESTSLLILVSCFEIMALWFIVYKRRKTFFNALRFWRHDRLLRVAVPFILIYSISLGMILANIGILARQRIFIFPFIFILLEAIPRRSRAANQRTMPRQRPRPHLPARRVPLPEPTTT